MGHCEAADPNVDETSPQMQAKQQQMDALIDTPIDFYGKVVDQSGAPVAGAAAKIIIMGAPGHAEDIIQEVQSGTNGVFSLKGIRAFGVNAVVTKKDYRSLPDKNPPGGWSHSLHQATTFPTEQNPAIYILQKKASAEPLAVIRSRGITVLTNGTPTEFSLKNGRAGQDAADSLQAQVWVDAHDPKTTQPYHWKFTITVPGGGLQVRDEHQFAAPSSGYQTSDTVDLAPGNGNWSDVCERRYFVQLPGGKYGRVDISINTKGGLQVEGYINPSGSQNLEFDPSKRIRDHAE